MARQDFGVLVSAGLLTDVEEIVVAAYLASHRGASRPAAYRWMHYEDPEPVARLEEAVRRLRKSRARFHAGAVDKACAEAAKLGYPN